MDNYKGLSEEELVDQYRILYKKQGIGALLFKNIDKRLYFALYYKGISLKDVLDKLSLTDEMRRYKTETTGWTWKKVIENAKAIVEEQSFLPPAGWFQANGMSAIVAAVYSLGKNWEDLRNEFNSFEGSSFVESRNGMRWRSHPEASISNFLYARGIEHTNGKKYPEEYSEYGDASYGYYDLHFKSNNNEWIDVEVWGDKPKGHNEKGYQQKRTAKEKFNENNSHFLGLHYSDCYEEDRLEALLEPYVGCISPFIFDKPTDKLIQPTHWSNADELIDYCKEIAKKQPNGMFPTEEWLRKRGKWKDREGPAYNTVSIYIKTWIGGVRKLREILGQSEYSTIQWDKSSAIQAYKDFYDEYGITAGQARQMFRRGDKTVSAETARTAVNICSAVEKYAGGSPAVNQELGIVIKRTKRRPVNG